MRPLNIKQLLCFRKGEGGRTLTQRELSELYGFDPAGTNAYFGINASAVGRWQQTGSALSRYHRQVLDDVRDSLLQGKTREKWVNLGLWPFEQQEPYIFVNDHLGLVEKLAEELHAYQKEAHAREKRFQMVVRFASEMNDPATTGQPWGRRMPVDARQQVQFKATFQTMREIFRQHAPAVRFAFSPALRRDHSGERYEMIRDYWPGEECVDLVTCTWYVGRESDFDGAVEVLNAYFREHRDRRCWYGLDEVGGIHEDRNNDGMLERMFRVVESLRQENVTFEYASLFLESKWGKDATLAFLQQPPNAGLDGA